MFLVLSIVSALLACAPSLASSIDVLHLENRVELFLHGGQNRVGQQAFGVEKRYEKYDSPQQVALESSVAPKGGAQVSGGKFDYLFGNATGAKNAAHNAPRTAENAAQMRRLGLFDDVAGRAHLQRHFDDVVNDPTNITRSYSNNFGNYEVRESLFAGPSGQFAKFETTWEILADGTRRLTIVIPFGGH